MIEKGSSWQVLEQLAGGGEKEPSSPALLSQQAQRFTDYSIDLDGLLFDFSKQRVDADVLAALCELAREHKLADKINSLMAGRYRNSSEGRWVRHPALRSPNEAGDSQLAQQVSGSLEKMAGLVESLRSGQWLGATGKPITDVVNLGVGGSDLGPCLAVQALRPETASDELRVHFASSMDGSQLYYLLPQLDPETTLFIVSSKSFTTTDTFACLATARAWLGECLTEQQQRECHLIGVSACPEKMTGLGIPEAHQLLFWDWVGGRFSLWSAIGLPIALSIGMAGFEQLLAGARTMDAHFAETPFERNIPVLMALLGIWNHNFLGIRSHACLPYDGRLQLLPSYLQQLEMESNGKSVTLNGEPVGSSTCPIVWGGLGTNGQHAFFQLLHQGTESVTADFVAVVKPRSTALGAPVKDSLASQQQLALANCLAQSRLLALGDKAVSGLKVEQAGDQEGVDLQLRYPGNTPSSTFLLDELTPFSLGLLLAAYEHKVFAQGVIWGINSFDQPGVELGKVIAKSTLAALQGEGGGERRGESWDASTAGLMERVKGDS